MCAARWMWVLQKEQAYGGSQRRQGPSRNDTLAGFSILARAFCAARCRETSLDAG